MGSPSVSFIIPVYNTAPLDLREALASCCFQTRQVTQIIVVDDGSQNWSELQTVVDSFSACPVEVLHVAHGGPGPAREAANSVATGDYIIYVDADDVVSAAIVEAVQFAAGSSFPDVIFFASGAEVHQTYDGGDLLFYQNDDVSRFMNRLVPGFCRTELRSVWAKAFRREFLKQSDLHFSSLSQGEDQLFMLEVSAFAKLIAVLPSFCGYRYLRSATSTSFAFDEGKPSTFRELSERMICFLRQHKDYPFLKEKKEECFYAIACEYVPRLLKIYFCHPENSKTARQRFNEAKKYVYQPPYLLAIRECRYRMCPTLQKRVQLCLLKVRALRVLFSFYERRKRIRS